MSKPENPQALSLTADQLDTLRHMLGINDLHGKPPIPYRDYFCADPGDTELHELQRIGAVELYSTHGSFEWFRCTESGRAAAIASVPKLSRSKLRYQHFLTVSDTNPDMTFRQFLSMFKSDSTLAERQVQ